MLLNNLKSIVILVTMECNCNCDHCFYFPRNDHNQAHIDPALIDDALESISGQHDITNGAWANNPEVVRKKLNHLRELGVNSIGVSADSFHQRVIPLENVLFNDLNPIIRLLRGKGALGLKQLAVEQGFTPNNTYYDECHLCHLSRNYLKKHCPEEFGEYLAPDTCYPPISWRGYGNGK